MLNVKHWTYILTACCGPVIDVLIEVHAITVNDRECFTLPKNLVTELDLTS